MDMGGVLLFSGLSNILYHTSVPYNLALFLLRKFRLDKYFYVSSGILSSYHSVYAELLQALS